MKPIANLLDASLARDVLYFLPLGGSGEIGMNFNLYGLNDQWIAVDVGITFADDTTPPGIEIITPDPSALKQLGDRLIAIIITHAHEDHVGALGYLWPKLKAPVYCTGFTASVAERKLGEAGLLDQVALHRVHPGDRRAFGPFWVEWISLTHSIPESHALCIEAAGLRVVHTGDWKLDPHPVEGVHYDDRRLMALGETGVDVVIGDSTNATVEGWSGSEAECHRGLLDVIAKETNRVCVTCFSSNTARLASLGRIAQETGRRITILGRSLFQYVATAKANGYLRDFPELVPPEDLDYLPKSEQLILATGSQGEARAAMARLARGEHHSLVLEADDCVVFSSKVIPGNEKKLFRLYDLLSAKRVHVVTEADALVHVSGHPCRDELAWMYRALQPTTVIPVHGEGRHMTAHAELARGLGCTALTVQNGDLVSLSGTTPTIKAKIASGRLGLSGSSLVPLSDRALSERRALALGGVVSVTVILDKKSRLVGRAQIELMGVPSGELGVDALKSELAFAVEEIISELSSRVLQSDDAIRETIQRELGHSIHQWMGVRPRQLVQVIRI